MKQSESIAALAEAFAAAQAEYVPVQKKKTAKVKGTSKNGKDYDYTYQYADLADILEMAIPRLSKQGLAFSQPHCMVDGKLRVVSYLLHKSGEWMHSDGIEISEISPDPQQLGIESTYFRRYDGSSFLGIAPDEDTDGQSAGDRARRTEESNNKPSNNCPLCGKDAIIKGKEEYGGGWLCYKAKGVCGAKFTSDPASEISHQTAGADARPQEAQPSTTRTAERQQASQSQGRQSKRIPPDEMMVWVKAVKFYPKTASENACVTVKFEGAVPWENQGHSGTVDWAGCFHGSLLELLKTTVGKECHFQVKEGNRKKDKSEEFPSIHFIDIQEVISITDPVTGEFTEYVKGQPVVQGEKQ